MGKAGEELGEVTLVKQTRQKHQSSKLLKSPSDTTLYAPGLMKINGSIGNLFSVTEKDKLEKVQDKLATFQPSERVNDTSQDAANKLISDFVERVRLETPPQNQPVPGTSGLGNVSHGNGDGLCHAPLEKGFGARVAQGNGTQNEHMMQARAISADMVIQAEQYLTPIQKPMGMCFNHNFSNQQTLANQDVILGGEVRTQVSPQSNFAPPSQAMG